MGVRSRDDGRSCKGEGGVAGDESGVESGPVSVMVIAVDRKGRISGAVGVARLVPDLRSQIARHVILMREV